ncbi:putative non-specific serine/threonine protein kinase [Helianthus annuus]|nr:putative non-specific serine/threonine protein kinase [Helianthus annuus]
MSFGYYTSYVNNRFICQSSVYCSEGDGGAVCYSSTCCIEILKPVNSNLIAVDAGYNKITGYLSANLSNYPMLSSLTLRYNKLHGPIPTEYSTLKRLFLDGNYLNGMPPKEFFSGKSSVSGSLGDNCLKSCPVSSELCLKSQKSLAICQQAYGGKVKQKS